MNRILFVCTGNTCRSPMAEGILRRMLKEQGLNHVEVRSAGVAAMDGAPVSGHAAAVLQEKGCSRDMRSTALTANLLNWADVVLTMTSAHKQNAIQQFPHSVEKIFTLKEFVEDDPKTLQRLAELGKLVADVELKRALSQPITNEERARIRSLERELPDYDIADPYGGPMFLYRECAQDIENCLQKLVRKLKA
ncbi:low molecular weight protein arginine phosphatase [Paenibacillus xerothermodurans]|uniref:Low molecular weight protein arginine phosphatase n=1 Tax=Paenibacillus xerothermodurans TaxID=1977292 RepID=A0A2W1N3W2_PAEXE|nr:low molecular weight protein arginine phosphatase [Paenibacillus xerothermodurans]PZE19439.1 low molecular weight protein arginine phosphatase [Paenibacillus xerothermodurans]